MRSRFALMSLVGSVSLACGLAPGDDSEVATSGAAVAFAAGPKIHIARFAPGVDLDETIDELADLHGLGVVHRYRHALRGAAFLVPNAAALHALASDGRLEHIEEDTPVFATGKAPPAQRLPIGYKRIGADATANEGGGVYVAVLDTGIDLDHGDLAVNVKASLGTDCIGERGGADDGNGHGSHVAGTIAALNNAIGSIGVGTAINLVPVKVLSRTGSGSMSSVVCGIDWVTAHADVIKVANMSLGGSGTEETDPLKKSGEQEAIEASVAAGVTYVVAAGNSGADASTEVPAAFDAVITVSAYKDLDGDGTTTADAGWPTWTNFGADVDIAAPGVSIYSTWKSNGYNTISGTSMASPHVAAAAALYISTHTGATPAEVRAALIAAGETTHAGSADPKHPEPLLNVRGL